MNFEVFCEIPVRSIAPYSFTGFWFISGPNSKCWLTSLHPKKFGVCWWWLAPAQFCSSFGIGSASFLHTVDTGMSVDDHQIQWIHGHQNPVAVTEEHSQTCSAFSVLSVLKLVGSALFRYAFRTVNCSSAQRWLVLVCCWGHCYCAALWMIYHFNCFLIIAAYAAICEFQLKNSLTILKVLEISVLPCWHSVLKLE